MKVLVLYHTKTGHTLEAINPMVEGLKASGSQVQVLLAEDFKASMISECDAFIVGTPCWAGSSGVAGVSAPAIKAINSIEDGALKGKLCGGVAVHAKYGGEATLKHLNKLLSRKGCENYITAPVLKAGVPFSLFKGPKVSKEGEQLQQLSNQTFWYSCCVS